MLVHRSTMYPTDDNQGYFISISDLMAGLIFIFIITLMVFALNLKGTEQDLSSELEKTEAEKENLKAMVDQLSDAKKVRSDLLREIRDLLIARQFKVEVNLEHGILHLPEEILFPSGSATLQPEGIRMLSALSDVFFSILPCYTGRLDSPKPAACFERWHPGRVEAVFIEGHTDNVPVSEQCPFRDNWDLSAARGIATYKSLVATNPYLDELTNQDNKPIFSVTGYAERRPAVPNDTEANRRFNRRIDIRFIMAPPKATPEVIRAIEEDLRHMRN